VDDDLSAKLAKSLKSQRVNIRPFVSHAVDYLIADDEEKYVIAQANAPLDADGHFENNRVAGALCWRLRAGSRDPHRLHGHLAATGGERAAA